MSFNANDINNTINLGNYEEYFVLYMDNELSDAQRKMVDTFLLANPDLQAELEILMSTKLPAEAFSFDKEALLSGSMKVNVIDEDLLLYIDNELPSEKKKIVELELTSNKTYQLQYQQIFQTKLDASEVVAYPNKEELYHRTERVIAFKPWMRVAAAIIVIAATGILYFTNSGSTPVAPVSFAETKTPAQPVANPIQQNSAVVKQPSPQIAVASATTATKQAGEATTNVQEQSKNVNHTTTQVNDIARIELPNNIEQEHTLVDATNAIAMNTTMEATTASFDPSEQIINKSRVTSALDQRNTINEPTPISVADNSEKKGSFKSFLRKATRMIERKTGIDATDGDDELLIGAVAVKLK
ncbi:MAG: anti-sigma factor family protein [Flavisolibacter sp.]